MTPLIRNLSSIDWKLLGNPRGFDLVAIITPSHGRLFEDAGKLQVVSSESGQIIKNDAVLVERYRSRIGARFRQPFDLFAADVSDVVKRPNDLPKAAVERVSYSLLYDGRPVGLYQDAMLIDSQDLPIPASDNIQRVAGPISTEAFLFSGASWYANLLNLASGEAPIERTARILDWGCGCGRIARYFVKDGYADLHGIDIDPFNSEWMQRHHGANFFAVEPDVPSRLPDAFFDIVYGHSVFTHLSEQAQFDWLSELRRVVKPDGRVYVTICSDRGVAITGAQGPGTIAEKVAKVIENGIHDFGHQDVGVDVRSPGYYRLTAHTHDYIARHWSRYFDVVCIVSFFAAHQDLVVLKRR